MSQNRPFPKLIVKVLLTLVLLQSGLPLLAQDQDQNLPLRVERHQTLNEDIFGFRQTVKVDGTVIGDVTGLQADIHLEGTIKGNITVLGGSVMFYKDARVEGSIMCINGRLINMKAATVMGNVNHYLDPENQSPPVIDSAKTRAAAYFALCLSLFLLVIIGFYSFPNQVHEAGFQLGQDLTRALIIGSVTVVAFVCAIIVSVLLMVVGIGYPLLVLFLMALFGISGFGLVIVFYRLGLWLEDISKSRISVVVGILLAVSLVSAMANIPLLGPIAMTAPILFGAGIVIETRFGTNKQWFTRKSRYWSAG